jgi:hypothetical protein
MSNTNDVKRTSAKQAPVKRLSPSGKPKGQVRKLPRTGRSPWSKGR